MNEALFARYFARCNWDGAAPQDSTWARVMKVGGRTFPVSVHYASAPIGLDGTGGVAVRNHVQIAADMAEKLHKGLPESNPVGGECHDILIFLTQANDVEKLAQTLAKRLIDCLCLPLHGKLEKNEQQRAFEPADVDVFKRKIVVSTNVAETSVTINGIGAVIDTGLAKQAQYDPQKDATVLRVGSISQSSARQRAGRAGRTAPGQCYRLYSEDEFEAMACDQPAELLRTDATQAILGVLRMIQRHQAWVSDVRDFPFIENPGKSRLDRSLGLLVSQCLFISILTPSCAFGFCVFGLSADPPHPSHLHGYSTISVHWATLPCRF
jgi:HrpA-like RNA helicase